MNVLIIEDEPQALEGMRRIVQDPRIERAFFCSRASEALAVIEEHRPAIIVTDIVLPDSTGLDLLESVRSDDYAPKVIIVSGFNDFEYAKRGLKLGAVDYFLKPFDTESFREKLGDCISWLEAEAQERQQRDRAVELAHLGTRSMRDLFLLGLCMQPTALQEHIVHRLHTLGLDWLAGAACHVIALTAQPFGAELSEREEELLAFATGNIVEELLQRFPPAVTFKNARKWWIIVTPHDDVNPLLDMLERNIRKYQKAGPRFGVSERTTSFIGLHAAYKQAADCLRSALLSREEIRCTYEQLKPQLASLDQDLTDYMKRAVCAGDEEWIQNAALMFVRSLIILGGAVRPAELSQRCMDWAMEVHHALRKTSEAIGEVPVALWDELDDCQSVDEVSRSLGRYFAGIAWQIRGSNKNALIEQALGLIHASYTKELKLQDLAAELAVHPVWLSQLFKKEVGMNFLEYVTDLRMQKAKELLRGSSGKIYEIAEQVGYQDVQHFGRLFKKKTGMTPKAYRYGR